MALLNNGFKGNILAGIAFGIGAAIIAPVIIPILSAAVKPMAKVAIKEGMLLYEKGKEMVEEARETIEDLVAEARSEVEAAQVLAEDVKSE
jgi:archaellin